MFEAHGFLFNGDSERFREILREFSSKLVDAHLEYYPEQRVLENFDELKQALESPSSIDARLIHRFTGEYRNIGIAQEVAKAYCHAIREKKPLVLSIGIAHLPHLVSLLRGSAPSPIPIRFKISQGAQKRLRSGYEIQNQLKEQILKLNSL